MKKRFRARFQFSIGTEAPDDVAPQAVPRALHGPQIETTAGVSTMLDRGMRLVLVISAATVFVVAVMLLATMDAGSRAQGGRIYVTIAAILILGAIDKLYGRLEWRRRPLWMEGPGEAAYRRYLGSSIVLLLTAAAALIALAIYLP